MDRDRNVGEVKCVLCGEHWSTKINALSEPIDVYSEWIDACEAENAPKPEDKNPPPSNQRRTIARSNDDD